MVNAILALSALGYGTAYEPVKKEAALENFTVEKADEVILQSCISPVWDTALTALSLLYSGLTGTILPFTLPVRG